MLPLFLPITKLTLLWLVLSGTRQKVVIEEGAILLRLTVVWVVEAAEAGEDRRRRVIMVRRRVYLCCRLITQSFV